jgi:hypothetical protein
MGVLCGICGKTHVPAGGDDNEREISQLSNVPAGSFLSQLM